jgi:hypothetical protein
VPRLSFPSRSAGPRPWIALLAALALVLQGLIPAAALAHDHAGLIQLCTAHGVKLVGAPDDHGKGGHFGGLACEQCVMASFAAVGAAPPAPPLPVRWTWLVRLPAAPAAAPPPARAPPRPPSQGPPTFA